MSDDLGNYYLRNKQGSGVGATVEVWGTREDSRVAILEFRENDGWQFQFDAHGVPAPVFYEGLDKAMVAHPNG